MTDQDATAVVQDDSREESKQEDSVNHQASEDKEPNGTPEAPEEGGEDTPKEKNDDNPEDPEGAPEGEEEEMDPLKKAKKHADKKISQMGATISAQKKTLIAAVKRSPELLIDLYDPSSELFDKDLADKIRAESPDTYQKANEAYKRRQTGASAPARPSSTPTHGLTEAQVQQMIAQQMQTVQVQQQESAAVSQLRETLGYSEDEFSTLKPALKGIAEAIRKANPEATYDQAYRQAFLAMFPEDFEKQVAKDAYIKASTKAAATSVRGGSTPAIKSNDLSDVDKEAARVAGLSEERYAELRSKGLI